METESGDNDMELCMKTAPEELPKEDSLKINGEINGSCVEDAVSSKDSSEKTLVDNRTNGEIAENEAVPSPENGGENCFTENSIQPCGMDVDSEVDNKNDEPESMEVSEVNGDSSTSVDVISDSAKSVENVENCVSNVDESASESEAPKPLSDSNEPEETKVCDTENVQIEENSNKSSTFPENDNHISEPSRNTEMEDLAKLSSHGSLEITLVKTPVRAKKEESSEDKSNIHSESMEIDLTMKTPEKGLEENDSITEATPEKSSSKKKKPPPTPSSVPPRRSSRNLNKTKSYADKDMYLDELEKKSDDSVEEVELTDPLADDRRKTPIKKTTIVVSDTKKLVEIAAGSKQPRGGKKEPTLVIIDTNSILSGKGAVPVGQPTTLSPHMSITPTNRPGFSMLPVNTNFVKHKAVPVPPPLVTPVIPPKPTILPSLTDDMYVVEAPSFIVPYVYEKPPVTPLKEFVDDLEKVVKEQEKLEKEERRKRKEDKEKEKAELKEEKSEDKSEEEDKEKVSEEDKSTEDKAEVKKVENEEEKTDTEKEEKKSTSSKEDKEDKSDTETDEEGKDSDSSSRKDSDSIDTIDTKKKSESYFENPLGKFFMQIGVNLVQEHVQADLLRNQKRKRDREGENCPVEVHMAINSLMRTLEFSKENNEPYKLDLKKCKLCNFKTESALVMAHHLETPHMRNYVYRCNFCTLEVRSPHDILFHMEAEHNVRGRLERAPAFHQCPNCPFEDNQKGKLSRHLLSCAKKYKPERNQEPPLDWEPPAKIPRVRGPRLGGGGLGLGAYTAPPLAPRGTVPPPGLGGRLPSSPGTGHSLLPRGRGRPPIYLNRSMEVTRHHTKGAIPPIRPGVVFRPSGSNAQPQVLLPSSYNLTNSQLYQNASSAAAAVAAAGATAKLLQQPSISITPLPRQQQAQLPPGSTPPVPKPGRPPGSVKTTFVICEICDGYIKDLEQLRNHMQWIHKVKIHPKMIYNRPPLNCQKCQFRFFTDQGLERHLLGSHGLVTSSMQEAANKGKDGGRCPVCGRVYQWKLLNHVARDHNMSLKPAHLSYKCTVCTATFGMYKQFENHVYSAHSVVAKRVMDKKPGAQPSTSGNASPPGQSESLLKPLKINDEITIIPQPARAKTKTPQSASSKKS